MKETQYPFEFMGFTVYQDYSICNKCKEIVVGGIIQKSKHWCECDGKGFYEGLMKVAEDKKESGQSLSLSDIDELISKELK